MNNDTPSERSAPISAAEIAGLVRMVNVVANHGPVKANCLPRSLAIWWLLRRRGVETELRFGVKHRESGAPGEPIQAHAWVERNGQVLNDDPQIGNQFAVFERAFFTRDQQKQ